MCVGGRTLVGEVCALSAREASSAKPRAHGVLQLCLLTLRRLLPHHHCRAILLKVSWSIISIYGVTCSQIFCYMVEFVNEGYITYF